GYKPSTASDHLLLMAQVSRWLASQNLDADQLTTIRVEQFLGARRDAGYWHLLSMRGMSPLLDHLRSLGAVPVSAAGVPTGPVGVLIDAYEHYLLKERGVSASSVRNYVVCPESEVVST